MVAVSLFIVLSGILGLIFLIVGFLQRRNGGGVPLIVLGAMLMFWWAPFLILSLLNPNH